MRKITIAGNWKMNCNITEAISLVRQLKESNKIDVIIAPPFTSLHSVKESLKGKKIALAAQNMHDQEKGAFTGEISPLMLKEIGCSHVIIGHSERRHIFKESDAHINLKLKSAITHGLKPIFCIGETLEERNSSKTEKVLTEQLSEGLDGIKDISNMIIAYEPVWAIGTGIAATTEQVEDSHKKIRKQIGSLYDDKVSENIKIIYGGSVNEKNAESLLRLKDVDGALPGGASLKAESFNAIIDIAEKID